jgi:carbonic anhydrase/acetyltransferase-like protein (isoleucine patch superfamily)
MNQEFMSFFDTEVSSDIRRQLFFAQASACMSDVERARFYGLPKGCRMREGAKIIAPENLVMGENVWIGENSILDASGGLEIGSNTSIGLGVYLWTHDSNKLNREGRNTREARGDIKRKPTRVGSNCFIAGPSVILAGCTIGDGCVIAPLSLVGQSLGAGSVFTPYRTMLKMTSRLTALEARIAELERA